MYSAVVRILVFGVFYRYCLFVCVLPFSGLRNVTFKRRLLFFWVRARSRKSWTLKYPKPPCSRFFTQLHGREGRAVIRDFWVVERLQIRIKIVCNRVSNSCRLGLRLFAIVFAVVCSRWCACGLLRKSFLLTRRLACFFGSTRWLHSCLPRIKGIQTSFELCSPTRKLTWIYKMMYVGPWFFVFS